MKQFLLIFALALSRIASGQVHGQFVTAGGEPIPFVNIALLRPADSAVVQTALTDSAGNYRLTMAPGQYVLRATHVGHRPWISAVAIDNGKAETDLGRIVLTEEKQQLGDVVVRAARPAVQQNIEGTVVNVQNGMMNKGSTVLNVLERSPGVILDHRNNSISLNGKNGITVLIDGKTMHLPEDEVMDMLNGMSADNVDKIELLTAPPSRYDASGSAGMINIVLKKSKRLGTTGSFSVNGGYGYYEKGGASVNVDHNTGRADWYGSYSFLHDHQYNGFNAKGSSINPAIGPSSFQFHDTNSFVSNNHNVLLGFERKLRGRLTLGASINYNNSTTTSVTRNFGVYVIPPDSALFFRGLIHGRSHWDNAIVSLTAEKDWRKSGKLDIGLDWLDYANSRPSNAQGRFVDSHGGEVPVTGDSLFASANRGFSQTTIRVGVGKIDYRVALNDRWRLEAGVKGDYTESSSLSGIESLIGGDWVTSAASSNAIKMREAIGAGYASMHAVLSEYLTMDAGVRYEYSDTRLTDGHTGALVAYRPLGEFFPSLLLTRKAGENGQWQLSFSRRIARPSYKDLSSFISYNDPFSVFTGNPQLKPTLTNNVKIGYSYRGYSLSLLLSRDDDPIFRGALTEQPGSQLVYIRPENMAFQNNLTFETSLPFTVNDWWTMSYGFVGGWRQYKLGYLPMPSPKTWFGYSLNFRENIKLPAQFSAELSGYYNSNSFDGANRANGFGEINMGLKKELGGNRGSLQLTVSDVFRMMNVKAWVGDVVTDVFNTHNYWSWDGETRKSPIFRLTYSRSFGSGVKAEPIAERVGEEKERIK